CRYAGVPRDAYWGAGAGDQLLFVVPSLNLIMVRNGETIAPLPGEPPILQDDVFTKYHDLRAHVLFEPLVAAVQQDAAAPQNNPDNSQNQKQSTAPARAQPKTRVALIGGRWHINDKITNPGSRAEGLLINVRMVNATFEDANPKTCPPNFDSDRNTARFVEQIPGYANHGVNAFTLCLQGGMPGYEGALNSAFESDGSLRPEYLSRVARVIDACGDNGLAVILGCYYQRQSKVLRDEDALRAGVTNVVDWIRSRGWQNVMLEIANEYPHRGFVHPLIRDPKGQASLLRLAKQRLPNLLVTASGYGTGLIDPDVAQACDFLTPHFNRTPVDQIGNRLTTLRQFCKPTVVNEDDKAGQQAAAALEACV